MVNPAYIRQLSNESDKANMAPKLNTLPHPYSAPMKPPRLHRSHSNHQPSNKYHQVRRQHSVQMPRRPSVGITDGLKFYPTTPVAVNGNVRGPITQMTLPVRGVKNAAKGMAYSLDSHRGNSYHSLQRDFQLYKNMNGNFLN